MPNRSVKQTRPQLEEELADHVKCILKLEKRVEELLIDELAYQTTERQLKERLTAAETQHDESMSKIEDRNVKILVALYELRSCNAIKDKILGEYRLGSSDWANHHLTELKELEEIEIKVDELLKDGL